MKDLKASIADVLPVMKKGERNHINVLTHALVESDGTQVWLQATDRFIIVNSTFAWGDDLPVFKFLTSIQALTAIKSYGANARVTVDGDGFHISSGANEICYGQDGNYDWPDMAKLFDQAWGDKNYYTPGENTAPVAFTPLLVKHIKDVKLYPRLNDSYRPSRFAAGGRVRGVIMPVKIPATEL